MEIEVITPERAAEMLANTYGNRPLRAKDVELYASAMRCGNWQLNGATIKVSDKGRLLDGQFRLRACIKAGVLFQTFVAYGVDESMVPYLDTHSRYTPRARMALLKKFAQAETVA
jgi:hypothetical protein